MDDNLVAWLNTGIQELIFISEGCRNSEQRLKDLIQYFKKMKELVVAQNADKCERCGKSAPLDYAGLCFECGGIADNPKSSDTGGKPDV